MSLLPLFVAAHGICSCFCLGLNSCQCPEWQAAFAGQSEIGICVRGRSDNRRVDLTLNATGQESALTYPINADDFASLVDRNGPKNPNGVELAAEKERIGN